MPHCKIAYLKYQTHRCN